MIAQILGRLLRGVHAGDKKLAWTDQALRDVPDTIKLTSTAFDDGGQIPRTYAGAGLGDNVSPPLAWANVPPNATDLLLIMEDPDAPLPRPVVHLIVLNIPSNLHGLQAGALSKPAATLRFGQTIARTADYRGPRGLPNHGPHKFHFVLVALSGPLGLQTGAKRKDVLLAAAPLALAKGRLVGIFEQ